jgi:CubicO group peptidase (beta-lactamase class C family)
MAIVLMAIALAAQAAAAPAERADRVDRLDALVSSHMTARHIPGASIGIVKDGRLVFEKGYGEASLEWHAAATPTTSYLLASVTKQFTAAAIMMLVREGRIALDDTLATYLPDQPQWARITIRQLLTHTAGLRDRFETDAEGRMWLQYSTADMLAAAARTPLAGAPGAAWQYSDQGYFLLGLIIEKVSGQRYHEFLRARIFTPAGMASTSLHDWNAIVPERADGYALAGGRPIGSRRRYQFALGPHYGVQSTVRDLAKYDAALSSGALLPPNVLEEMWTPGRLADGGPAGVGGIGYGYGWFLERFRGHPLVYHGGSTGVCLYRLPDDAVSVIVLTNLEQVAGSDPCGLARRIAAEYVPAIVIANAPPLSDPDPARTRRLRAALEAFARSAPAAADYTPAAFAILEPMSRQQGPALTALGPVTSFELIADDESGERVVWFRARHGERAVHYRFSLDASGKITSLRAQ